MKIIASIILILYILFYSSCGRSITTSPSVYNIEIESDGTTISGLGLITTKDTVLAYNDLEAFKKAYKRAIGSHETSKRLYGGKVYMFSVMDSNMNNIGPRLDMIQIDSIIRSYEEIRPKVAKEVGETFYYGM